MAILHSQPVRGCPFCIENGKVEIIAHTGIAYLVQAKNKQGQKLPGRYLIIPKQHVESLLGLPDHWQISVRILISQIPEIAAGAAFTHSGNEGKDAGKTVDHVHLWVIIRAGEEDKPSYQLGTSGLIDALNKPK